MREEWFLGIDLARGSEVSAHQTELKIGGGLNILASRPEVIIAINDRMDPALLTILSTRNG
ncbi:hypothetical protein BTUL_0085g00200 [Botrytis tulipae]|uniref:Uncharacterized protein n=1 Tax=Botrytis tulipae TaxID=87230 RepID=A0A4Z1EM25_9HELO|nr:hypothetical protein BTUL_0085g00200 [Botrytis tulipae]